MQKIFGFYDAKDKIVSIHGKGSVKGQAGPDNTHCTHIGPVHRAGIYPALKEWFGMPIPEEYSKRRSVEELTCWTDKAKKEPYDCNRPLFEVCMSAAIKRSLALRERMDALKPEERGAAWRKEYAKLLGNINPVPNPKLVEGKSEKIAGGKLQRLALEVEPGIIVPFFLISPKDPKEKAPVVLMVAQGGKAGFLKERGAVIETFLKGGVVVCLVDVRGTGETHPGDGSPERTGARTSISQTNLILGQPVIGSQLHDLRTVIRWLQKRKEIDGNRLALWGDSFAPVNASEGRFVKPLDAPDLPHYAEPGGGLLAGLAALYEGEVLLAHTRGTTLFDHDSLWQSHYLYAPHDSIVPGADFFQLRFLARVGPGDGVDFWNTRISDREELPLTDVAAAIVEWLCEKEPPISRRPFP